MPTGDKKNSKHQHIKTLTFKNLQAENWHFCCSLRSQQTYFTQIPVWFSTFVSGTLCLAFMWSATQLTIATLAQARAFSPERPFANFTTHKSDFTVRVGNLLFLVSIICAKNGFEQERMIQRQIDCLFWTDGASTITSKFGVKLYSSLVTHCNF